MLRDANGEKRKEIEVRAPRHYFPSSIPMWVVERISDYNSQGFYLRDFYSMTIRDLMLAGF